MILVHLKTLLATPLGDIVVITVQYTMLHHNM